MQRIGQRDEIVYSLVVNYLLFSSPFYERIAPLLSILFVVLGTAIVFYEAKMRGRLEKIFILSIFFVFSFSICYPFLRIFPLLSLLFILTLSGIGMFGI